MKDFKCIYCTAPMQELDDGAFKCTNKDCPAEPNNQTDNTTVSWSRWQVEQLILIGTLARIDWSGHMFDGRDVRSWIACTIREEDIRKDLKFLIDGY